MKAGEEADPVEEGGDPACWAHLFDEEADPDATAALPVPEEGATRALPVSEEAATEELPASDGGPGSGATGDDDVEGDRAVGPEGEALLDVARARRTGDEDPG